MEGITELSVMSRIITKCISIQNIETGKGSVWSVNLMKITNKQKRNFVVFTLPALQVLPVS